MNKYVDASILEKDGWTMQRCRQVSSMEMLYETRKPTDFPAVDVEEVRHGRLRRRIVYRGEVYNALESARINALDGILPDPYKEGFHDGIKRAIQILVNEIDDALTIIEAEEE